MNKIYILIIMLVLAGSSLARGNNGVVLDSLQLQLENADTELDQLRANVDLGEYYQMYNSQKASHYLNQAVVLSKTILDENISNDPDLTEEVTALETKTYLLLSYYYYEEMRLSESYALLSKVDSISRVEVKSVRRKDKKQYYVWISEALQNRGYVDFVWGETNTGIEKVKKAIAIAKAHGSEEFEGRGYRKLGDMYSLIKDYEQSEQYYAKAAPILAKYGFLDTYLAIERGRGNQNVHMGKYLKAIDSYERVKRLFIDQGNYEGAASSYYNIAYCYNALGEYEQAIYELSEMQHLPEDVDFSDGYDLLAIVYLNLDSFELAIDYANKALALKESHNNQTGVTTSNELLSYIYLKSAKGMGEYSDNEPYLNAALAINEQHFDEKFLNNERLKAFSLLKTIIVADSLNADFRSIVRKVDPSLEMQNELREKDNKRVLRLMMTEYESMAQKQTIAKQENQISNIKQGGILIFALLLIAIAFAYILYRNAVRQKQANALLKEQNELIEHQQQKIQDQVEKQAMLLDFKEKMTNMIIHDLKTPLNGIMNVAYIDDPELKDEVVRHSANEMMNLVQNLLEFYKSKETGMNIKRQDVDLSKVVEAEKRNIKFILDEKSLKLELLNPEVSSFKADYRVICRIISNIFSNAAKYSPRNGLIEVRATVENGTDVKISVRNQGPTIPATKADYIFEPFGQSDGGRMYGHTTSTGLGLTFCKMAVEAHGGKIGVTPNMKEGAEFWFTLPNSIATDKEV